MKFIRLYIKNNIRRRKSNYLIPLFSFFLSGLLICITVFYLTLEKNISDELSYPRLDMAIASDAETLAAVEEAFSDGKWMILSDKLDFADIMPLYREEIAKFDEKPVHRELRMTLVDSHSIIADMLREHHVDVGELGENEVYVSQYIFYYLRSHIQDHILTLDRVRDKDGKPLQLMIKDVLDAKLFDFLEFSVITSNPELLSTVTEAVMCDSGILFYEVPDKGQRDRIIELITQATPKGTSSSISSLCDWQLQESSPIYSGDVAIAAFNFFFAALCMICTLKMKFDREAADYRRMKNLGYAPIYRVLLPFADLVWIGILSYAGALLSAAFLFRLIAPHHDRQSIQSTIYSYYFTLTAKQVILTAAIFGVMLLFALGVMVYLCIIRSPRTYHAFVKQSSNLYTASKFFYLPYVLVRFSRNKLYNLFFVFMLCFPLFVCSMYGTGAVNLVSNDSDLFADAAFTISRDDLPYGSKITQEIADDLRSLPGVASVQTVHKSNLPYTLSSQEHTLGVQFVELNDYMVEQITSYLAEGSIQDVMRQPGTIVLTDNSKLFKVGDTVYLEGSGQRFVIGAILRNVPLEHRAPMALIDLGALESLTEQKLLPSDLHVYLNEDISDEEYRIISRSVPNLIYDPHAAYQNQRNKIAVLDMNGRVVHDAASSMNLLICIISVLSVFLYHIQQIINRQFEFDTLHRMGLGNKQINILVHIESLIPVFIGLGLFSLLYGGYVSSIIRSIQESQSYQYADFSFAWREIVIISLSIIGVVELANLSVIKKER